ncbi:MAG: hypothetical protein K8F91_22385 [Candidatus Obscuribacterales bacterium]|nr:hypothetical protein [Candidatus Obscuribacterales bacterium]
MNIPSHVIVPGFVLLLGIVAVMLLVSIVFAFLGYVLASRRVESRNNMGHIFGMIFGLLFGVTILGLLSDLRAGVCMALLTIVYTRFVWRLQRGY